MSFRIGDFRQKIDPTLFASKGRKMRSDGRAADQLRPVTITTRYIKHAEGSALIVVGETKVICTASVEERVPPFLKGQGEGWITSEYGMLPRSTNTRVQREVTKGKPSGRTHEIQRLIGRSLRAGFDLDRLGPRTLWIDCDVLEADGGTRTAAITGGYVALVQALRATPPYDGGASLPLADSVAAVSVGMVDGRPTLDLDYRQDYAAAVDMNVVMTGAGRLVELQGTGEEATFDADELAAMLALARKGIVELGQLQATTLDGMARASR